MAHSLTPSEIENPFGRAVLEVFFFITGESFSGICISFILEDEVEDEKEEDEVEEFDVTKLRRLDGGLWDSLAHVSLIVAIESEFDVVLRPSDMAQITSLAAAAAMLEIKLSQNNEL